MTGRDRNPWRRPSRGQALSEYLREARIGRGLSQDDLVRLTGLSLSSIRKIEDGRTRNPGLFTLRKMWHELGLPVEALQIVKPAPAPERQHTDHS